MKRFARGSEWRKWDLHVHAPNTALNNGYTSQADEDRIDTFCRLVNSSDVAVLGITDYFDLMTSLLCIERFHQLFPDSDKLLLPNMELRLLDVINSHEEHVNAHLLFRDDITPDQASDFMRHLETETTIATGRKLTVKEAVDQQRHASIMVSTTSVDKAYERVFGRTRPRESMLIIVPMRGGGIRPPRSGTQRVHERAAEIDGWSDAMFGSADDREFFLDSERGRAEGRNLAPKPVFAGSDSHGWADLTTRLGRAVAGTRRAEITWVKADPTFEGLQQTLVEPSERVRIQSNRPDQKEPYQLIRAVRFSGTTEFPEEIPLNQNLVSVIGTRSSGKSALLAYIAYAVDPAQTIRQQVAVGNERADLVGPAAGITWREAAGIRCEVEWADNAAGAGQVIFIPQNSLFALSARPEDITNKIRPVLYRQAPPVEALHLRVGQEVSATNAQIREAVGTWFELRGRIADAEAQRRVLGERSVVEASIRSAEASSVELRASSGLDLTSDGDAYDALFKRIDDRQIALQQIDEARARLRSWIESEAADPPRTVNVTASITTTPRSHDLPATVREQLEAAIEQAQAAIVASLSEWLLDADAQFLSELDRLREEDSSDRAANQNLIDLNAANDALQDLLDRISRQKGTLAQIEAADGDLEHLRAEQTRVIEMLERLLAHRDSELGSFSGGFREAAPSLDGMTFGVEIGVESTATAAAAQALDFRYSSRFFDSATHMLLVHEVRSTPRQFLEALATGSVALRMGHRPELFAAEALTVTEEIRFLAHLQGDRIGGFAPSTMTPGKQALFALTLILNETDVRWPILIDQPEDDLDSRSMYDSIVPYLKARKRERQIIMVSHNANLVIGADSEQVIVANRHGDDRPNRNGHGFEYLSGSLEHSHDGSGAEFTLEMHGIREHACALLDGGEEAFKKRRDKYRIAG